MDQNFTSYQDTETVYNNTTDDFCEKANDNDSPTKDNLTKTNESSKIKILEEFEIILDSKTGTFYRKLIKGNKDTEMIDNATDNKKETEENITLEDDTMTYDRKGSTKPEIKEKETRKKERKRKATNTFKKSCIDFLDSENEDFSVGSSNEWSNKECGEESSSSNTSDKPKKSKKKKKKKDRTKEKESVSCQKTPKVNVAKL